MAIWVICNEPGCPRLCDKSEIRGGKCPEHAKARDRKRSRGRPRDRSRAARQRRLDLFKQFGNRCAAIHDGKRCTNDAEEEHHIDSDPTNDRWSNRVPVCKGCHRLVQDDPAAEFALP